MKDGIRETIAGCIIASRRAQSFSGPDGTEGQTGICVCRVGYRYLGVLGAELDCWEMGTRNPDRRHRRDQLLPSGFGSKHHSHHIILTIHHPHIPSTRLTALPALLQAPLTLKPNYLHFSPFSRHRNRNHLHYFSEQHSINHPTSSRSYNG